MAELRGGAKRRLEEEKVVWCATVRRDGSPHLTPVWFVFDDGTWWIATARRNVKVANIERQDQVSLALPDTDFRDLADQGFLLKLSVVGVDVAVEPKGRVTRPGT